MAADFNAGSIEGTLDLDTRPFAAGLRWAKMKAADFGKAKVTAKADLDSKEFTAKKDVVDRDLAKIDRKKATAKADLDISEAVAKAEILNKVLSRTLDAGGLGKSMTSPGLMVGKLIAMAGGAMSLAAAMGPLTVAVAGFGAAAAAAFGGAMVSFMLFAKIVASDFGKIQKAVKAGQQLAGSAGVAETAYKRLTAAFSDFQKKAGGGGYKFLATAFNGLAGVLPKLVPLLRTVTNGMDDVLRTVLMLTKTPVFDHFLKSLQGFMHGFLQGLGPVLFNMLSTFMHVFIALRPLMSQLGGAILHLSSAAATFASGSGLTKFVHAVQRDIPPVIRLVSDLIHTLMHIGTGLAPLSGPALKFIDGLVRALGKIDIAPFARGFGDVLNALRPLLPIAAALINVVLKPLGALLSSLASGPLKQITQSLSKELRPAFKSLGDILHTLVKPVSQFLGSIANLANPTGVHLVATLLKTLSGVIKVLAPSIGHLAVAFESVIDTGINAIIPLLPKLTPLLMGVAHGTANVADGLAAILSHKSVALTLLGIIGAIKTFKVVSSGVSAVTSAWDAVTGAISKVRDMCLLTRAQLVLLKIQEIAVATWGKAVQIATKAWAAAQWLLNVALDANPIGIVIVAIAALAAGLIYAYNHSKTFRDIVQGAFHAIGTACSWMWNNVIKPVFKLWLDSWLFLVKGILDGAAKAFGWVPGLGSKLKTAAKWFDDFTNKVNNSLDGIKDKTVHVGIAVAGSVGGAYTNSVHGKAGTPGGGGKYAGGGEVHGPGTSTSDSVDVRASNGEFIVNAKAYKKHRNLVRAINRGFASGGEIGGTNHGLNVEVTGGPSAYASLHRIVGQVNARVNGIAAHLKAANTPHIPAGIAGPGGGVRGWAPIVLKALSMLGLPATLLGGVLNIISHEGSSPTSVNRWDSNWTAGHPSVGLMQTIAGTFAAYAGPFRNLGPFLYGVSTNPLAQIYAGINYALHRYGAGMIAAGGRHDANGNYIGYANGTASAAAGWHWVGERGPELMRFRGGERVLSHGQSVGLADNASLLSALQQIIALLQGQPDKGDQAALAQALGKMSDAKIRQLIQEARAA